MTEPIRTRNGIDISGQRFGRLVAIHPVGYDKWGAVKWECLCDCGNTTVVVGKSVRTGNTTSCGCFHRELVTKQATRHGGHGTPEYGIWLNMLERCRNPKNTHYPDYGGRGIAVCVRWQNSFEAFLTDVGPRPSPKHSVDRFPDMNGDYEPGNVRWATGSQQCRNTRRNRILTLNGVSMTMIEWAEHLEIPYRRLQSRKQKGWSDEKALTTLVDGRSLRWK